MSTTAAYRYVGQELVDDGGASGDAGRSGGGRWWLVVVAAAAKLLIEKDVCEEKVAGGGSEPGIGARLWIWRGVDEKLGGESEPSGEQL